MPCWSKLLAKVVAQDFEASWNRDVHVDVALGFGDSLEETHDELQVFWRLTIKPLSERYGCGDHTARLLSR